jgi:hypothetical protein
MKTNEKLVTQVYIFSMIKLKLRDIGNCYKWLWKESLYKDGQQFHPYQQNEQSFQLMEHKKRQRHMTLEIQILVWDRHKIVVGLNRLIGSQPSYFW